MIGPICDTALLKGIIETFGVESQMFQAVEELSELITALSHHRRGRITVDALTSEIADVTICIDQIALAIGISREQISRKRAEKLNKIERMMLDEVGVRRMQRMQSKKTKGLAQ